MGNVMVIPAKRQVGNTARQQDAKPKLRVAAYCRVSTDSDEQATSYEAQVEHYTEFIQKNPEWEFAGIYADDGISGTNTKNRDEFNRMIEDCEAGTIDMIITKSISRCNYNQVLTSCIWILFPSSKSKIKFILHSPNRPFIPLAFTCCNRFFYLFPVIMDG